MNKMKYSLIKRPIVYFDLIYHFTTALRSAKSALTVGYVIQTSGGMEENLKFFTIPLHYCSEYNIQPK